MAPWKCESRRITTRLLQLCLLLVTVGGGALAHAKAAVDGARLWVAADVNGDHKPELLSVTVSPAGTLRPQQQKLSAAAVTLPKGVPTRRLEARDIDGDADADLVLETLAFEPIAVWLNDGTGDLRPVGVEPFRFQLSHKSPQTLSSSKPQSNAGALDDTGNSDLLCTRSAATAAVEARREATGFESPFGTTVRLAPTSRGPPQNS